MSLLAASGGSEMNEASLDQPTDSGAKDVLMSVLGWGIMGVYYIVLLWLCNMAVVN